MTISIRPATSADLPEIGRLSDLGFKDHPWSRAMYPVHDGPGNIQRYINRHTKAMGEPQTFFFVAVEGGEDDPSAPIVGYSKWTVTREQQPESEWNTPYEAWPVPEGARQDANDKIATVLHDSRLKHYKGEPMVLLNFCVVPPEHQRKGIGGQLMKWGVNQADELRLPSWVESTEAGFKLYAHYGFEPVDEINVDFSEYGVKEPGILTMMKRNAKS